MNILITGANGYLGKCLISKLEKYNVIPLTRENNTKQHILDTNPDVVIHTICSYGRHGESISQVYESNLFLGIKIIETIKEIDKKIVFINCGTSLEKYTNLYSISKKQLVEYGNFASDDRFQFINMNLEHFYGPNASNNFVMYVINQCIQNKNIDLTIGTQRRDFIYIDDVCAAFDRVISSSHLLDNFENIDVGTGTSISIREVVETIKELTNSTSKLEFGKIPLRSNELKEMKADISILNKLGWKATIELRQGLTKILREII